LLLENKELLGLIIMLYGLSGLSEKLLRRRKGIEDMRDSRKC
jgi:hypothetical protein